MPRLRKLDIVDRIRVWAYDMANITNEIHLAYGYLRHPKHNIKLDYILAKVFVLDMWAVFDAMYVLRDLGVDITSVEELYRDELADWREMRNDIAHSIERYYRIAVRPRQSNDPTSGAFGRIVAHYDPRDGGTLTTGSSRVYLRSGLFLAMDIFRFIFPKVMPLESLVEMQRSVLWATMT